MLYHTAYHVDPDRGGVPKGDGFSSFVHEREQLIEAFDKLDKPVLIFTGDVHASASVQITDNVWEMMCGPMGSTNHPLGTSGGGTMPLGGDWNSQGRPVRVKWIGTFPDNVSYSRLRQPYFAVVQVNNVTASPRPQVSGTNGSPSTRRKSSSAGTTATRADWFTPKASRRRSAAHSPGAEQ